VCPRPTATPGQFVADPTYVFASVAPSPSGDVTAVGGWKLVPLRPDCSSPGNNQYTGQAERGIYALGPGGARGALIRAGVVSGTGFDWEPTPVQLTVDIDHKGKPVRMHNVVPRLSETPGEIRWAGGALGADNDGFYEKELGLGRGDLERLRREAII